MSDSILTLKYKVSPDDFKTAGEASSDVKSKLKQMGLPPQIIRKVAIAMYEGEITGILDRSEFDQEAIMKLASGAK